MSRRATAATCMRVLTGLRHDRRTVALLLLVPTALLVLLRYVFGDGPAFQHVGVPLIGVFPLISMFLVASVTLLHERTTGTLERLMTLPIGRGDIVAGYAIAFAGVALVQIGLITSVGVGLLGLSVTAPVAGIVVVGVLNAVLGMSLGLFVSAFAATEFQAVQFMPALLLPQLLVCGILAPRDSMAWWLRVLGDVAPITYAYDAMRHAATTSLAEAAVLGPAAVVAGCTALALALASGTLRRRTA